MLELLLVADYLDCYDLFGLVIVALECLAEGALAEEVYYLESECNLVF